MYNQAAHQPGTGQQRWRVLGVLLGIALLLQLAGLVAPGWIFISMGSISVHIGLWFVVACGDDDCETRSTSDVFDSWAADGFKSDLKEYKVEACTAVICCIIAIILAQMSRAPDSPTHMYGVTAFFAIASGILALVPSGKVLDNTLDAIMDEDSSLDPPYALILTLVGGCLACIAALAGGWYVFRPAPALPTVGAQPQVMSMPHSVRTAPTMPGQAIPVTASAPPGYIVPDGGYTTGK